MFVELYKNNETGLTKQNVLEKKNVICTQKNENKHLRFSIFIANMCDDMSYMYI